MSENLSLLSNSTGEVQLSKDDHARFQKNLLDTMAGETVRAYRSRLSAFAAWCDAAGRVAMPASPGTVAAYLEYLESTGHKPSTINQVIAAISKAHNAAGVENPCMSVEVKAARKAAARRAAARGEGAPRQKAAATVDVLRAVVGGIAGGSLADLRDRALLLLGFAGAFRRSELAALRVSDLSTESTKDGRPVIVVTVRKSKTDQTGAGMTKAIFATKERSKSACPVRAVREWIAAAGLSGDDVLFPSIRKGGKLSGVALSGHSVAAIVQNRAAAAGVELDLSGHSLRRGFVTSAVEAGATERAIMNQTGHKSVLTVRRYIERHDAIADNAASLF